MEGRNERYPDEEDIDQNTKGLREADLFEHRISREDGACENRKHSYAASSMTDKALKKDWFRNSENKYEDKKYHPLSEMIVFRYIVQQYGACF